MSDWNVPSPDLLTVLFGISLLGLLACLAFRLRADSPVAQRWALFGAGLLCGVGALTGFILPPGGEAAGQEPIARPTAVRVVPAARDWPREPHGERCFEVLETAQGRTSLVLLLDGCSGDTWRLEAGDGRVRWQPVPWD